MLIVTQKTLVTTDYSWYYRPGRMVMNKLRIGIVVLALALIGLALPAQAQNEVALTHVRVAHFSPDTPAVQIFVNGELGAIQDLSFGEVSGWVELFPGTYEIAVAPVGASIEDAAIGPVDVTLGAGGWYTVSAIGSLTSGTLTASVFNEDYSTLAGDEVSVSVFHAIEDAPAVDVILADGTVLISSLAFGEGAVITVPEGTYDLQVVAAGTSGPAVIDLPGTPLNGATFYLVSAINSLANPGVSLAVLSQSPVSDLIDRTVQTNNSIVDIAVNDGRFTTLVAALQTAGLVEALQGPGPFTVFAPTDAAFADLLDTLGITAEELLARPDLADILLFHVSPTRAFAADVASVQGLETLQGTGLNVGVDDQGVALDFGVRLLQTDIEASNGVIHVIDGVLLP